MWTRSMGRSITLLFGTTVALGSGGPALAASQRLRVGDQRKHHELQDHIAGKEWVFIA